MSDDEMQRIREALRELAAELGLWHGGGAGAIDAAADDVAGWFDGIRRDMEENADD